MQKPIQNTAKRIAEELSCGFRAFMHKTTSELIFIPDEFSVFDFEREPWEREMTLIENHADDYYEIDKWSSKEAFEMMSDFADQLSDFKLKSRLFDALSKSKPFRGFKSIIENDSQYRQDWFDFKSQWQEDYVARQLERL